MKITGTMINYFIHCKRQCWLFANRINLEENSEEVRIGRLLHQLKADGQSNVEVSIDSIKIDKITDDYLVEIKKSDADTEAVYWQVLFYLKILEDKGIERKGKIEFIEKNKQSNKIIYIDYTEARKQELEEKIMELQNLLEQAIPPEAFNSGKCKKCAYHDYCFS